MLSRWLWSSSSRYFGVRFRLLDQALEDGEDAGEPGLGGDEVPAAQALHPADHVLRRGGEVVARLVLALEVVLPQPGPFGGGPVVQVLGCLARELVLAVGIPQAEEHVVQAVDELLPAEVSLVGPGEGRHEERDRERGVLGAQQGPACMVLTQRVDCVVVHPVLGVPRLISRQFTLKVAAASEEATRGHLPPN